VLGGEAVLLDLYGTSGFYPCAAAGTISSMLLRKLPLGMQTDAQA
jgi:hypothetical protein